MSLLTFSKISACVLSVMKINEIIYISEIARKLEENACHLFLTRMCTDQQSSDIYIYISDIFTDVTPSPVTGAVSPEMLLPLQPQNSCATPTHSLFPSLFPAAAAVARSMLCPRKSVSDAEVM